ncbi:MAG: STAS domain-containing protein [Candidatus Eremiobacteraeota bacterium]|nr:STAS domain-containing protein [Candidatus Eremiobacteraeota bacterium]MBC5827990.1 STAS domain-containing protein [Candidatus Eremiobacteraeota bacterium]
MHDRIIDVAAPLNGESVTAMSAALHQRLAAGMFDHFLDLSRLATLDSAALGALIRALRSAREVGASVSLIVPSPQVHRILEITALTRVFKVHRSRWAAVDALRAAA